MKKQKIQMIILICILVLGLSGYFIAKNIPEDEETTVASESHSVTNVDQSKVKEMTYLYQGEIIELIKEGDTWKSKDDTTLTLNQTLITTMLGYVCQITSETMIDDAETLEEYGLTNPTNTICLTLEDDSLVQVLVGDYLDLTGDNYILLAGDPNVYTISSYTINSFNKSIEDLIEIPEETEEEIVTEEVTEETVSE